ncbi:hypothetical protein LUX57_00445 [Actinomadura madurae]|nr:hypothetical protein [Actinomadura madurae]MCP9963843.1 hypothetical protein [Actinomadura madurae]
MPRALARTAGTSARASHPSAGTTIATAATTVSSGPNTGAPTESANVSTWPSLIATPVRRTSARTRRSSAPEVIVLPVKRRSGPAMACSCTSGSACASIARPTPVACAGQRPPTRENTCTASRAEIRSM